MYSGTSTNDHCHLHRSSLFCLPHLPSSHLSATCCRYSSKNRRFSIRSASFVCRIAFLSLDLLRRECQLQHDQHTTRSSSLFIDSSHLGMPSLVASPGPSTMQSTPGNESGAAYATRLRNLLPTLLAAPTRPRIRFVSTARALASANLPLLRTVPAPVLAAVARTRNGSRCSNSVPSAEKQAATPPMTVAGRPTLPSPACIRTATTSSRRSTMAPNTALPLSEPPTVQASSTTPALSSNDSYSSEDRNASGSIGDAMTASASGKLQPAADISDNRLGYTRISLVYEARSSAPDPTNFTRMVKMVPPSPMTQQRQPRTAYLSPDASGGKHGQFVSEGGASQIKTPPSLPIRPSAWTATPPPSATRTLKRVALGQRKRLFDTQVGSTHLPRIRPLQELQRQGQEVAAFHLPAALPILRPWRMLRPSTEAGGSSLPSHLFKQQHQGQRCRGRPQQLQQGQDAWQGRCGQGLLGARKEDRQALRHEGAVQEGDDKRNKIKRVLAEQEILAASNHPFIVTL